MHRRKTFKKERLVPETCELPNETTVWSLDDTRAEPVRRVADFLPEGVRQN